MTQVPVFDKQILFQIFKSKLQCQGDLRIRNNTTHIYKENVNTYFSHNMREY